MPTSTKLDAEKSELPNEQQAQTQANPQSTQVKQPTDKATEATTVVNDNVGKSESKNKTASAFPVITQIGWLEAFKRTDGPQNENRDTSIWMEEFASSALFGAFWRNAAVMFTIPVVCYVFFKFGGGFVSLILIIAFGATYYKNSIRRFKRNARDDIARELIRNTLENNIESTEWINNFLSRFWLIYEPILSASIIQTVDGVLVDSTPSFLDSIRLSEFTLGTKAPRVESIKTYPNSDPDVVLMDWKISFTPTDTEDMTPRQLRTQINPKICLMIRVGKGFIGAGMPILVEDLSLTGEIQIKLRLTSNFPHIKTFEFFFLDIPTIDYVLKPVGGETFGMDIGNIPGMQSFIRDQTHAILGPMMYAPNAYVLDLEQMMSGATLNAAIGIVQFTIYNAKDLKNLELVGNSDPYVKLRLGNRPEIATTQVQEDTLNPVWNETNIILLNSIDEVVCMDIFDKDNVRKDRSLGQASFDLKSLEDDPVQDDVWCKVLRNGKERGSIRIRAAFFPIQKPQPSADGGEPIPVESNSGILTINVAQAKDIVRSSKNKSLCQISLNGKMVHETKKQFGSSPSWWGDTDVFISDLQSAQINVDVISNGQVVGSYGVSATKLLQDTENKVEWASLKGGEGTGKIKMTGVWKPILMDDSLNPSVNKPPFGVLRVQLLAGRDIKNVEIGSNSDPYVIIQGERGISQGRTKTIENNLNPVWNEIHYVSVNSLKQSIDFEVFDYQKMSKDRTLGKTSFKVSEVIEELPDDKWYAARPAVNRWAPLIQKDGSSKGELHYDISFFPSLKVAQEAKEKSSAPAPIQATPGVEGGSAPQTAAVTLPPGTIRAEEVLDHDSGILVINLIEADLARSGTYCEFYVDSDDHQFKSKVQKTRNPKWNEFASIFVKELEYAKLVILIKEKSSMEKDPVVASFTSNIRTLLESTPAEGQSFPLEKTEQRSTIRLRFEYLPIPIELLPKERLDNMGNLTVDLIRAKNLIAVDRGDASDPYVVFKVNGKEVHKSEVIKKTLDPEYNEHFVVPINSRADDQFSLEVFDWNQLSAAKSLGVASIDLKNIQLVLPNDFLIPLQNKRSQGEVQLRLKFIPEFLSSNKAKTGFGSTFLVGGVNMVAHGGQAVGQGALDVTGAVGKGAFKAVGTVGKGVFGGLSAGASAVGLKRSEKPSPHPSSVDVQHPTTTGVSGNLTLHVIEADGLLGVDKSGLSDPYVKVTAGGQNVLKTKVKKETLTPNWNESAFLPVTGQPLMINFLVKDYNTIGGNKDLGDCNISLWDYIQPAAEGRPGQLRADFWAPLSGSGGRLHLVFEFQPSS
ncbi:hypothetical protein BGZ80_005755 [Entomortierella chlamydospora]|uniref:Membrane bound c2 domain protein n=1 Tax=Entomortierella chlamydospora TaxID=101097 RepID=A0A9P6MZJ9_9FUNG|nr:hypothetical protein BGZ80_005755 [Entomortierella chlamydospora]